jgi:hypothetical protein
MQKTLTRDIAVVVAAKLVLAVAAATFRFGPHQRPRIDAGSIAPRLNARPPNANREAYRSDGEIRRRQMPKMKAAIFIKPGRIVLNEKPIPEYQPARRAGPHNNHDHMRH